MLVLIFVVRERDFELNLAAEQDLLLNFLHLILIPSKIKNCNENDCNDLLIVEFG